MGVFSLLGNKTKKETDYQVQWTSVEGNKPEEELQSEEKATYRFPAEWEEQSGVQLTWPHEGTDWNYMLPEVTECYVQIARAITRYELLLIITPSVDSVRNLLSKSGIPMERVRFLQADTNDTWARDHGAITLVGNGKPRLLDFRFNGWGGKYEAEKDNLISRSIFGAGLFHGELEDHDDFVLEGGSIESDGNGTVMTTTRCLYGSPGRNESYSQEEIERYLKRTLCMEQVLWLDHGAVDGDDTDGHIDTLARFVPGNTILYVRCTDPTHPDYDELVRMEEQLRTFRNTKGEAYRLQPLPCPRPTCEEDGRYLPATYANFLLINGAVLYPTYGQETTDKEAGIILQQAFPEYDIIGIDCRSLIRQNGSLHCVTMQYPKDVLQ